MAGKREVNRPDTTAMELLYGRAASSDGGPIDISTGKIREWRSIITLIVFVLTSKSLLSCVDPQCVALNL